MTALITQNLHHEGTGFWAAVLIEHRNMEPDVPWGSLVFLDVPGFKGEGIYLIPFQGSHTGDLKRITGYGERWRVKADNWPGDPEWHSARQLIDLVPARVGGSAPLASKATRSSTWVTMVASRLSWRRPR